MAENTKLLLDKFEEHINTTFEDFCQRHQMESTPESLLTYLIDQNIIAPITIKHYTVQHEFENLFQQLELQKTKTVCALSDKFNIPERTIWGILKKSDGSQ
jgi:hypothetical protein